MEPTAPGSLLTAAQSASIVAVTRPDSLTWRPSSLYRPNRDMLSIVTDNEFTTAINGDLPLLAYFWAPWAGPCRMVDPIVMAIAEELEGKLTVAKVNADDNSNLSSKYGVRSIPTCMLFSNGKRVVMVEGAYPKSVYMEKISPHL